MASVFPRALIGLPSARFTHHGGDLTVLADHLEQAFKEAASRGGRNDQVQ
jgi:hypothetical protein